MLKILFEKGTRIYTLHSHATHSLPKKLARGEPQSPHTAWHNKPTLQPFTSSHKLHSAPNLPLTHTRPRGRWQPRRHLTPARVRRRPRTCTCSRGSCASRRRSCTTRRWLSRRGSHTRAPPPPPPPARAPPPPPRRRRVRWCRRPRRPPPPAARRAARRPRRPSCARRRRGAAAP